MHTQKDLDKLSYQFTPQKKNPSATKKLFYIRDTFRFNLNSNPKFQMKYILLLHPIYFEEEF